MVLSLEIRALIRSPSISRFLCVVNLAGSAGALAGCPNLDDLRASALADASVSGDTGSTFDAGSPSDAGSGDAGTTDLIGSWDFDRSGDVAPDGTGHGHDANLVGGATQDPGGVRGGALVLHGLDRAHITSLSGGNFPRSGTLALWFRYTSGAGGIFDDHDQTRNHIFVRKTAPNDAVQIALQLEKTTEYAWVATFNSPAGVWLHVALTWNESARHAALYLGGKLLTENDYLTPFAPSEQAMVFGSEIACAVDEVRLYSRALTAAEITTLPGAAP